jgi:hypothetical protein
MKDKSKKPDEQSETEKIPDGHYKQTIRLANGELVEIVPENNIDPAKPKEEEVTNVVTNV